MNNEEAKSGGNARSVATNARRDFFSPHHRHLCGLGLMNEITVTDDGKVNRRKAAKTHCHRDPHLDTEALMVSFAPSSRELFDLRNHVVSTLVYRQAADRSNDDGDPCG